MARKLKLTQEIRKGEESFIYGDSVQDKDTYCIYADSLYKSYGVNQVLPSHLRHICRFQKLYSLQIDNVSSFGSKTLPS
jgi:hypothetical protein